MAAENGDFRRASQARDPPPLPKCHARARNDAGAQMAIAGAGEIMEWNKSFETWGTLARA
jgi:hypothetical protein